MFFRQNNKSKRVWAIGLDFGTSQVSGVLIRREATALKLDAFDMRPLPPTDGKPGSVAAAAAVVSQLFTGWSVPDRCAFAAINPPSAIINQTELPQMPLSEARAALHQQNLSNCYFDLLVDDAPDAQQPDANRAKMQLLVGAATREEVRWYRDVMLAAKIRPAAIELATLTVVNGLLVTEPELCQAETILLVDFRTNTTAINFIHHGRLLFTYVIQSGSRQITEQMALNLNLDLATAEKLRTEQPIEDFLQPALTPLAQKFRNAIDFFEGQHEHHVSRAFACGAMAGSAKTLEILSREAGIHLEAWNCLHRLDATQTQGGAGLQLAAVAPELAAAVGAALARVSEPHR